MGATSVEHHRAATPSLRGIAALFLASAVVFFPLTNNPLTFEFFDAESETERLAHVEDHLGALRLLFTGIGLTEVALGVALWLWGKRVAECTPGRRGDLADKLAWVALASGAVALLTRLTAWTDDTGAIASDDLDAVDIVFLVAGGGFSLSFLVFGWLMIRGAMPTWLGVVWMLCGVMFWVGILPLWFFLGALVFGIRGIIRFRAGSEAKDQISATRIERTAGEENTALEVHR